MNSQQKYEQDLKDFELEKGRIYFCEGSEIIYTGQKDDRGFIFQLNGKPILYFIPEDKLSFVKKVRMQPKMIIDNLVSTRELQDQHAENFAAWLDELEPIFINNFNFKQLYRHYKANVL